MSNLQYTTGRKVLQRLLPKQETANKKVQCSQSEINQKIDDDMKSLLKQIQDQKNVQTQMEKDSADTEKSMKELIGRSAKLMSDNRMYAAADSNLREKLSVALDKVNKIGYEKAVRDDKIALLEIEIKNLKAQVEKGQSRLSSMPSTQIRSK